MARSDQVRVLGIPCPWTGDENDPVPPAYWAWFRLYRAARVSRHWLGLHDWTRQWNGHALCSWCGDTK